MEHGRIVVLNGKIVLVWQLNEVAFRLVERLIPTVANISPSVFDQLIGLFVAWYYDLLLSVSPSCTWYFSAGVPVT